MNAKMCLFSIGVTVFSLTLLISTYKNILAKKFVSEFKELMKNASPGNPV